MTVLKLLFRHAKRSAAKEAKRKIDFTIEHYIHHSVEGLLPMLLNHITFVFKISAK